MDLKKNERRSIYNWTCNILSCHKCHIFIFSFHNPLNSLLEHRVIENCWTHCLYLFYPWHQSIESRAAVLTQKQNDDPDFLQWSWFTVINHGIRAECVHWMSMPRVIKNRKGKIAKKVKRLKRKRGIGAGMWNTED